MSFLDPKYNIEQLGLNPGQVVVDLGAGSGFYSREASRAVGSGGRVYAIDVQKELLDKIRKFSISEGLFNIETIWGDIEKMGGTKLTEETADVVILSNILFQVTDKDTLISESKRILKPNGRVLVVDWADSFGGMGPIQEAIFPEEKLLQLMDKQGFAVDKRIIAGDHHYGIIFRLKNKD